MIRRFLSLFRRRRDKSSAPGTPAQKAVEQVTAEFPAPAPGSPRSVEERPRAVTGARPEPFPSAQPRVVTDVVDDADLVGSPVSDPVPEQNSAPTPAPRADVVSPTFEIELPDLSGVEFINPENGYAPPPAPEKPVRRARRSTSLAPRIVRELVGELNEVGPRLAATIVDEAVDVVLPTSDAQPGYLVAEIEEGFLLSDGGHTAQPRTLRHALTEGQVSEERAVDDLDRLELARLVAMAVDGLHRADIVLTRLDLDTFAFSTDGRPRVALVDGGGLRRLGGEFLTASSEPRCLDDDRADFAGLVATLLSDGGHDIADETPGLSAAATRRLQVLLDRAAGPPGTRAPVSEWLEVLGR